MVMRGQGIEEFGQREAALIQLQLAGFDLGIIQHIIDDGLQALGTLAQHRQVLLATRGRDFLADEVRHADHAIERGAYLMAHDRHEFRLGTTGRLRQLHHAIQLLGALLQLAGLVGPSTTLDDQRDHQHDAAQGHQQHQRQCEGIQVEELRALLGALDSGLGIDVEQQLAGLLLKRGKPAEYLHIEGRITLLTTRQVHDGAVQHLDSGQHGHQLGMQVGHPRQHAAQLAALQQLHPAIEDVEPQQQLAVIHQGGRRRGLLLLGHHHAQLAHFPVELIDRPDQILTQLVLECLLTLIDQNASHQCRDEEQRRGNGDGGSEMQRTEWIHARASWQRS